ncbi:MAG: redoxin [Methylophilaceae bacterium 17-44-8]|jgi:thiol-disulfide isomerase/thioredoxin|nr:MAG: redoxin [Methylophilales bacterium 28-44-11]OZA04747.1 MAG: redoxin [Methylophilaceae bacterium 17-44-8]
MFAKLKTPLIYLTLIAGLGFGIFYFFLNTQVEDGAQQSTAPLFAASFPDENGVDKPLSEYQGKIVILNFWATWCEPCREEMPELSDLHTSYAAKNVVVLGVAIDEVSAISEFSKETKVSYPLFAADMSGMEIATNLGNNKGVLPYTVIIKADGTVHKTFFGRISKALLEKALQPLL